MAAEEAHFVQLVVQKEGNVWALDAAGDVWELKVRFVSGEVERVCHRLNGDLDDASLTGSARFSYQ